MWRTLAFVLVGATLLAPAAAAKLPWAGHADARGDGEPDALSVAWVLDEATGDLLVHVQLAQPPAAGTEVQLQWMRGAAGEAEPQEWYVVQVGPQAHGVAGHAGQVRDVAVAANWTEDSLVLRWTRLDPSEGACIVLAAEVGVGSATGFQASDAIPDRDASRAWPTDGSCPALTENPQGAVASAKGSPAVGLLGLLAALAVLVVRRR